MSNTIQTATTPAETVRQRVVDEVLHSGEMESPFVTPAGREDVGEYIAGRIDSDELVARARARYRLG